MRALLSVHSPSVDILTEKRIIQEAVDTLIDNGKRGSEVLDANKRPMKSIDHIIEGKRGRFRQNILGNRGDYSGRSSVEECGMGSVLLTCWKLVFAQFPTYRRRRQYKYVQFIHSGTGKDEI